MNLNLSTLTLSIDWQSHLPKSIGSITNHQKQLPMFAKDQKIVADIEQQLPMVPSEHHLVLGDARKMDFIEHNSVHLVLTSPPYWTLKEYRKTDQQMGHIKDYQLFLEQLDLVWQQCFDALVPGGRLICVVGDVCLSRRKNGGRHMVVPLHASIQEHCRNIGFDNLAPIIWHKIANASYEVENGGGGFLGKPYEPNAIIKNDIEFILMERKPGGYRKPSVPVRVLSLIPEQKHRLWFQQIWTGLTGASTKDHPAPYPLELAERLIRMYSFVGDVVVDPFLGSGTTCLAAARVGRNSIGVETDPEYFKYSATRVRRETEGLFTNAKIEIHS
ncbi:MAG: site-specific DNA-methyltransferase [Candidatus Alcyoniella australis]|nr:site-specific DNA-methyltransferase [Candidatus Alcyoniella australis]